jgi:hypothetical protein
VSTIGKRLLMCERQYLDESGDNDLDTCLFEDQGSVH